MLGKKLVINVGSGARRNCDAESGHADRLRTDSNGELREYSIAW